MLELSSYSEMMARCSHCGLCQATCPVYLEDLLHRPVDLVTNKALRAELRPFVEREAIDV